MPSDVADRPAPHRLALAAALLFFAAAVVYSCLEIHASTDTWIGLACGRQIAESPTFPVNDTFSFTAAGHPSYNQNWLTHRIQYWFYANLGPDSVIYFHWATVVLIHVLVAAAAWWRTGSAIAALLTAGVVAFSFRDYLSPRPATLGFLCMAAIWAMLCALAARRDRAPWWPLPVIAAALLTWGQVHGSFSFGFAFLGLFIVQAVVLRVMFRDPHSGVTRLPTPQIAALAAVLAVGVAGTVLLSPFGLENLKHGEKIRASDVFRHVNEWYPPLGDRATLAGVLFPSVWRFGVAIAVGAALAALAGVLRLVSGATELPIGRREAAQPPPFARPVASNLMFDLVILGVTISMTLWARRFAPVLMLFGGPIVATWIVALAGRPTGFPRSAARIALALAAIVPAGILTVQNVRDAREKLIDAHAADPTSTLLDRFTLASQSPLAEIEFLKRNELAGRVFCEWGQAALVMWHFPEAKVFKDARAQQLYDEDMFRAYIAIDLAKDIAADQVLALLDGRPVGNVTGTRPPVDIVIIRAGFSQNLQMALDGEIGRTWVLVFRTGRGFVYLRKDSEPFRRLGDRLRAGQEWRPDTADAMATRGEVWFNLDPPDLEAALRCYKSAADGDPAYVTQTLPVIMRIQREAGRLPALLEYIDQQIQRFSGAVSGMTDDQVRVARGQLARWREMTLAAIRAAAGNPADRKP